jgi:hypothetical protein
VDGDRDGPDEDSPVHETLTGTVTNERAASTLKVYAAVA